MLQCLLPDCDHGIAAYVNKSQVRPCNAEQLDFRQFLTHCSHKVTCFALLEVYKIVVIEGVCCGNQPEAVHGKDTTRLY